VIYEKREVVGENRRKREKKTAEKKGDGEEEG